MSVLIAARRNALASAAQFFSVWNLAIILVALILVTVWPTSGE